MKKYVYGSFERNKLYNGEEFAFYPVPFCCAVMTGRMVQILQRQGEYEDVEEDE